jgi:hypothetical protein
VTPGTAPAGQLTFRWDLDDDGAYDDADTGATPTLTTTLTGVAGRRSIGVEVSDGSLRDHRRLAIDVRPAAVPPSPPTGTTATTPGTPTGSDTTPPRVTLRIVARSGSRLLVLVACPGERSCRGTLTLRSARKVRVPFGLRVVTLGRAPVRLGTEPAVLRVRLTAQARRLLKRGRLPVVAVADVRDAAGNLTRRTARATLRRG